jgi:hypothetical protein
MRHRPAEPELDNASGGNDSMHESDGRPFGGGFFLIEALRPKGRGRSTGLTALSVSKGFPARYFHSYCPPACPALGRDRGR